MLVILILLGLIFGSFVNALVWRTRQKNHSIWRGRSICPNCKHELAAVDLVPIFSWLWLKGHCRYCNKPISRGYPLVEILMAAAFGLSYLFWPDQLTTGQWVLLSGWLAALIGLVALAIYDLKWMILPNQLIYPTLAVVVAARLVYIVGFSNNKPADLGAWVGGVAIASGLFWLIFHASKGRLIGYGDVRLGLVTGTLLAAPLRSLLMIFTASVLGTLVTLPAVIRGQRKLNYKLPYGPFLIAATALVLLFGQPIIDWYSRLLNV